MQLQLLFDMWHEHRPFTSNPLDFNADAPVFRGRRRDAEVMRAVTQGEGVTGAKRATNPFAFARNFLSSRGHFGEVEVKVLDVKAQHTVQLSRGLSAQREFLSSCLGFCIAADATRLSGKDRLMLSIVGRSVHRLGETKAMWAPPQVCGLHYSIFCLLSEKPKKLTVFFSYFEGSKKHEKNWLTRFGFPKYFFKKKRSTEKNQPKF